MWTQGMFRVDFWKGSSPRGWNQHWKSSSGMARLGLLGVWDDPCASLKAENTAVLVPLLPAWPCTAGALQTGTTPSTDS